MIKFKYWPAERIQAEYMPIWEACDREAAFALCNQIRADDGLPLFSAETFDTGWQYRTIFANDYEQAEDEFLNLVYGWW